jgi:ribonuclease HI
MPFIDKVILYTDGGSKGNPGPGAIAALIYSHEDELLYEYSECIGHCTNNQSEYKAVIKGLSLCAKYTRGQVTCFTDSELLVKHMNAVYRLKNDVLRELFYEIKKNCQVFSDVLFQHSPRNHQRIQKADGLVKNAHQGRCVDKCYIKP